MAFGRADIHYHFNARLAQTNGQSNNLIYTSACKLRPRCLHSKLDGKTIGADFSNVGTQGSIILFRDRPKPRRPLLPLTTWLWQLWEWNDDHVCSRGIVTPGPTPPLPATFFTLGWTHIVLENSFGELRLTFFVRSLRAENTWENNTQLIAVIDVRHLNAQIGLQQPSTSYIPNWSPKHMSPAKGDSQLWQPSWSYMIVIWFIHLIANVKLWGRGWR